MYKLQTLKSNRNDCKNDKKTNLLGEGARSAVQKIPNHSRHTKFSANNKVCIIHKSDISCKVSVSEKK